MTDTRSSATLRSLIYETARFVDIPGDSIKRFIDAMKVCGYELSAVSETSAPVDRDATETPNYSVKVDGELAEIVFHNDSGLPRRIADPQVAETVQPESLAAGPAVSAPSATAATLSDKRIHELAVELCIEMQQAHVSNVDPDDFERIAKREFWLAEEAIKKALSEAQRSATLPTWVQSEKAKEAAYEDAARVVDRMAEGPQEGRRLTKEEEWACIKLEDAAKAIRERKAKMCQVTRASPDRTGAS